VNEPSWLSWIAAAVVLYLCFLLPDNPWNYDPVSLARFPLEVPLLLLAATLVRTPVWRGLAPLLGGAITVVVVLKIANNIALGGFGRSFSAVADLALIPVALGTLARSNGALAVAAVVAGVAVIAGIAFATFRALIVLGRGRTVAHRAVAAALSGIALAATLAGSARTTPDTTQFGAAQIAAIAHDLRDTAQFGRTLQTPAVPAAPSEAVFADLRGVDVLVIFVESYGRSALERPPFADGIRRELTQAQAALANAGFHAVSAWAVSPTYGGESWLAHSTLLSGLPVTTQARYQALTGSDRSTLSGDFKRAGWRTVALMPEITSAWPQARYFGFDEALTAPEIGYRGPAFGYITMPDQFVLKSLADRALAEGHPPVMATVALVSSHIPWAPIPKLVPWDQVGDGRIFATARSDEDADAVWRQPGGIGRAYGQSIEYVLRAVTSFITTYGNDRTLILLLGDHQPMSFIAGDISHDVPVHVIARDPALLRAFTEGRWTDGMLPGAGSPVLPMESLRGQITAAFTPATQR
jgi:hypothetical protein